MSATSIRAYWPLIKSVVVPLGVMKIVLIVVAIFYALILIAGWFWKGHFDGASPLLLAIVLLYSFLILIILPSQAMTTISSKSLRYLTDFRKFYLVVAVILSMAFPLAVIIFRLVTTEPAQEICTEGVCAELKSINDSVGFQYLSHFGLQVWLLSSAYVIGLFFTAYRFPLIQGAIFLTFAVIQPILQELSQWSFWLLLLALGLCWTGFAYWWLRLKPQKYFINAYAMSMEQMMTAGTTANPASNSQAFAMANLLTAGVKPASFLGTRLLGSPDGKASIIPGWIFTFFIALLFVIFFKWLMGDNFQKMSVYVCVYSAYFLIFFGASTVLVAICRNIKPLWLFYPGTRKQMFLFIEKNSLVYAAKMMLIAPVFAVLFSYLANINFIGIPTYIGIMLSAVLVNALTFYLSFAVYARDNDRKLGVSGWQGASIALSALLFTLISYLLIDAHYISAVIINCFLLATLLILRSRLINRWQTINFVRVG
jgi:hypothetical protein